MKRKEKSPKVGCVKCLVFVGRERYRQWGIFVVEEGGGEIPQGWMRKMIGFCWSRALSTVGDFCCGGFFLLSSDRVGKYQASLATAHLLCRSADSVIFVQVKKFPNGFVKRVWGCIGQGVVRAVQVYCMHLLSSV